MRIFFDSSAFAKRYVREPGSDRVLELCAEADRVVLSQITPVEVLSAATRLRRDGALPTSAYRRLKRAIGEDVAEAELIELSVGVIRLAIHALERAPLRTLDAFQVGAAMHSKVDLFVSADARQIRSARVLRLKVEHV